MQKLATGHLKVDTPLLWDVYDADGQLLLRKGFVIEREAQIENLINRGMFVHDEAFKGHPQSNAQAPREQRFDPFGLWQDIPNKLGRLLRSWDTEPALPQKIQSLAAAVHMLNDKNPDAALAAIVLMDKSKYATVHALHVAVLCDMLARHLSWPQESRQSLVCAALTMNISIMDLQSILTHQKTPPSDEQRAQIRAHPNVSCEYLKAAGVQDPVWLTAILEHHESPDGSGYPAGHNTITEEALLLRTADVFSAKLADRANRKGMEMNAAVKMLFVNETQQKNPFAGLLIKEIGIFPPGTFVKLANGETSVVIKRGQTANTPLVFSLSNGRGVPMLDAVRRDTGRPEFAIASVIPRDKVMVALDLDKIWNSPSRA